MAEDVAGEVEVVTVVDRVGEVPYAEQMLHDGIAKLDGLTLTPDVKVLASDTVAQAVSRRIDDLNGAMVVMSAHGHGRSAAVFGSVVDDLLRTMFGPLVVIGPQVDLHAIAMGGIYVVPIDGSDVSEMIIPIAQAWAIEFGGRPRLVEWIETSATDPTSEPSAVAGLAATMSRESNHVIEAELLSGDAPGPAIVKAVERLGASMVFMTTHGRTGLRRLRLGSVAADLIRSLNCPVVVYRPPHLV